MIFIEFVVIYIVHAEPYVESAFVFVLDKFIIFI